MIGNNKGLGQLGDWPVHLGEIDMKFTLNGILAATALSVAFTGAAHAKELRFAIGVPDKFTIVKAMQYFEDTIPGRTNGEITAKLFTGSSLMSFSETLTGVRDGIADMGYVVSAYHRAELPESNLIGDLGMTGAHPIVMAGAASEYCFTDAECTDEYQRMGQVFLGFASTPPYRLISKEPLETLDDIQGKKIRSFSAYGRWAQDLGGTQVNLPAGEIYEAFTQGTIDVNMHPYEALVTLNLADVAKYVTDIQLGTFYINALFNTNQDLWQSLSAEKRIAIMDTAAEGIGRAASATFVEDQQFHNGGAAALGVTVVQPDQAVIDATQAFLAKDVPGIAQLNEEQFGVTGAAPKIDRFRALIAKWEGLVAGVDAADPAAVASLFQANLFGGIDKSTYGM